MKEHRFPVHIYYEDTDHSGVVYHANYLRYFERARDHLLGLEFLKSLLEKEKIGFAVYNINVTYKEGAKFGDLLSIRTRLEREGRYRLNCIQQAWLPNRKTPAVSAVVQLVCVNEKNKLVPVPALPEMEDESVEKTKGT